LREALGEGVAHEGGGRGATRLEAHPEADEGAAQEGAPVARQDLPRLPHDARIDPRSDTLEGQSLLHGQQDLADPEEADDRHDEVEALHQLRDAERQAELAGDDVDAGGGRMQPTRIDTSDFSGLPPPSPMNDENVRIWMAKNSGGPNLSATSARS